MSAIAPQPIITFLKQKATTRPQGRHHPSKRPHRIRHMHEQGPTMDQIIRFCLKVIMSDIQATDIYASWHVSQETGINVGS
jgi:hypothetical protein